MKMRTALGALTVLALLSGCTAPEQASSRPEPDYIILVPEGASEEPSGQLLDVVPQERHSGGIRLLFKTGDVLRVVNEDAVEHTIGLVVVRPGETIDYIFSVPGEYVGACTLLSGEEISVLVS